MAWTLLGMVVLLIACLASALIIVSVMEDVYDPERMAIATLAPLDDWSVRDDDLWQELRSIYVPISDEEELDAAIEDAARRAERENSVEAHFELALLLLARGDDDDARRELVRAVGACEGDVSRLVAVASALESRGYEGDALGVWLEALSEGPDDVAVRAMAGRRLYNATMGLDLDSGELSFGSPSMSRYSDLPLVRVMRALFMIRKGNYAEAQSGLEAVLEDVPGMPEALLVKGFGLAESGSTEAAVEIWESLATDPEAPYWVQDEARRLIWAYTEAEE